MPGLNDLEKSKFSESFDAVKVINIEHHAFHEGDHYFSKGVAPFNGGAAETAYFMFVAPDSAKRANAKVSIYGSVEFNVTIFEGATVSANGTLITTFNNDRESTNTPGLTAYSGPTVTDEGTAIWVTKTGTGRVPSGVAPGLNYEIIAARDTIYLFKLVKVPANVGYIDFDFWWYEHEDSRGK